MLQQALQQFEGSLMIGYHDRDFLDPIVNKTLEIQPQTIKTWLGNVSYYLERKAEESAQQQEEAGQKTNPQRALTRKKSERRKPKEKMPFPRKTGPTRKQLSKKKNKMKRKNPGKKKMKTR